MDKPTTSIDTISKTCIAVRLRLLNRVVTNFYDDCPAALGTEGQSVEYPDRDRQTRTRPAHPGLRDSATRYIHPQPQRRTDAGTAGWRSCPRRTLVPSPSG